MYQNHVELIFLMAGTYKLNMQYNPVLLVLTFVTFSVVIDGFIRGTQTGEMYYFTKNIYAVFDGGNLALFCISDYI